jgi:hypothetical protein
VAERLEELRVAMCRFHSVHLTRSSWALDGHSGSLKMLGPASTLVRHRLPQAKIYDLLYGAVFLALSRPGRLAEELAPRDRFVVIDEVQRLPEILNEERGTRFLLTGSSTRRL